MRTSVTLTRSKVKVKVKELLNLLKLQFSSLSPPPCSRGGHMVGGDSMRPGLQLVHHKPVVRDMLLPDEPDSLKS